MSAKVATARTLPVPYGCAMSALTHDELRRRTLQRQFPPIPGRDQEAVLELLGRLGPIQTQVPRAPFLVASSRLPGVAYADVNGLFADHRLVKTSSIRGTVHTSTAAAYARLDPVARLLRATQLRASVELGAATPEEVFDELERHCADDWLPRDAIVDHLREWLAEYNGTDQPTVASPSVIWGHSGLLRRPRDEHWERRTDAFHRTGRSVLPDLEVVPPEEALADLALAHLGAYGPVTRADLAYFFGVNLKLVDRAVNRLGAVVEQVPGPEGQSYLELASPPPDVAGDDLGVRLLPEFDGLLLGFAGPGRTRFCTSEQLTQIWTKANATYSPVVLHGDRLVATWKTLARARRIDLEVTMLTGEAPLPEEALSDQAGAVGLALNLPIGDLRVLARSTVPR